jgi:hypothetical protein
MVSSKFFRVVLFVTQSITNRHTTTTPLPYGEGLVVCVIYNTLSAVAGGAADE